MQRPPRPPRETSRPAPTRPTSSTKAATRSSRRSARKPPKSSSPQRDDSRERTISEIADLVFHLSVLMVDRRDGRRWRGNWRESALARTAPSGSKAALPRRDDAERRTTSAPRGLKPSRGMARESSWATTIRVLRAAPTPATDPRSRLISMASNGSTRRSGLPHTCCSESPSDHRRRRYASSVCWSGSTIHAYSTSSRA